MKKILIAIDYNPTAEKVAETGYAVAKGLQSEVMLVHVITEAAYYAMDYSPIMGYTGSYTAGALELADDIRIKAESFLEASKKHLADESISTRVLKGEIAQAILDYSIAWKADLIVMGSHTHHGIDRLFTTDIAAYMLKHSKIPLLVIPTH